MTDTGRKLRRLAVLVLPVVFVAFLAWRLMPPPRVVVDPLTPGPSAGVDDDGDPLPAFAVRRFGSTRLRTGHAPLALSPDGVTLYSGHDDGLVRVWDVASGKVVRTIDAHVDAVRRRPRNLERAFERIFEQTPPGPERVGCVVASPDGKRLATCSEGCVRVFDAATGERLAQHVLGSDGGPIGFSAEGRRLVLFDPAPLVWDVGTNDTRVFGAEGSSTAVADDGHAFVVGLGASQGKVTAAKLVDLATLEVATVGTPANAQWIGAPSPRSEGLLLWMGGEIGPTAKTRFTFTDARSGEVVFTTEIDGLGWSAQEWLRDGSACVLTGARDVYHLRPRTGEVVRVGPPAPGTPPAPSAGRNIAWRGGVSRVTDLADGHDVRGARPYDVARSFAWAPTGDEIALVLGDGSVVIANPRTGARRPLDTVTDDEYAGVRWDAGGESLALLGYGSGRVVSARRGPGRVFVRAKETQAQSVIGGSVVDVVLDNGQMRVVREGAAPVDLEGVIGFVNAWPISADGLRVGGFPANKPGSQRPFVLGVWDLHTGKRLATFPNSGFPGVLAISRDGSHVANCWGDVQVWSVASPASPRRIPPSIFGNDIEGLALSPDGSLVASLDSKGRITLVSLAERRRLALLAGHPFGARAIEFSADGRLLASSGDDGTVLVWDVEAASRPR